MKVCLEGEISKQTVLNSLSRGQQPSGDLIPWLISQQVYFIHFKYVTIHNTYYVNFDRW